MPHDHTAAQRSSPGPKPSPKGTPTANPVLKLQRMAGNRAVSSNLAPVPIQRDLNERLASLGSEDEVFDALVSVLANSKVDNRAVTWARNVSKDQSSRTGGSKLLGGAGKATSPTGKKYGMTLADKQQYLRDLKAGKTRPLTAEEQLDKDIAAEEKRAELAKLETQATSDYVPTQDELDQHRLSQLQQEQRDRSNRYFANKNLGDDARKLFDNPAAMKDVLGGIGGASYAAALKKAMDKRKADSGKATSVAAGPAGGAGPTAMNQVGSDTTNDPKSRAKLNNRIAAYLENELGIFKSKWKTRGNVIKNMRFFR